MMEGNFVAKHMRTFNKGSGAHVNQKRLANNTCNLRDLLDEIDDDYDEGWDFKRDTDMDVGALIAPSQSYSYGISL